VFVDETSPGSRAQTSPPGRWNGRHTHSLIADNAAGHFMQRGTSTCHSGRRQIAQMGRGNKIGTMRRQCWQRRTAYPLRGRLRARSTSPAGAARHTIEERAEDEVLYGGEADNPSTFPPSA